MSKKASHAITDESLTKSTMSTPDFKILYKDKRSSIGLSQRNNSNEINTPSFIQKGRNFE